MRQIGMYEAKTRFSQIVAAAEAGETFVITRSGVPVAELRAVDRGRATQAAAAAERLLAGRGLRMSIDEIVEAVHEGRR